MGIRQGPDAIKMYEEHIRFMILAEHELCEETTAAADQEAFNSHLNLEQINKVNMQQGFTLASVGIVAISTSLSWVLLCGHGRSNLCSFRVPSSRIDGIHDHGRLTPEVDDP